MNMTYINHYNTDKTISDYYCVLNSGNLTMAMELPHSTADFPTAVAVNIFVTF